MKRFPKNSRGLWLAALAVLAGGILAGCAPSGPSVLVVLRERSADMDYMLEREIGAMSEALKAAGFRVVYASEHGTAIKGATRTIQPDLKLEAVKATDYAGVFFSCMAEDEPSEVMYQIGGSIAQAAAAAGLPLAAQNGGVLILARAGVLSGKGFALQRNAVQLSYDGVLSTAPDAKYMGTGLVRDGSVSTSGTCPYRARDQKLPDGTPGLADLFVGNLRHRR